MKVSDAYVYIADLISQAEAILECREREERGDWAITAFSRFRIVELLGLSPSTSYGGDLDADPAALLEEAVRAVDQLVVPIGKLTWHRALADALRCALADVRMVQRARHV
ncbi:hypothetical protein OHB24_21120 [Kribbella sp. NBC_00482]|uniref:hypothetical protein n=1 Tax=Kribbella sp. NBC_00482 TaxID=2975968 RepID=UPI002E17BAFE